MELFTITSIIGGVFVLLYCLRLYIRRAKYTKNTKIPDKVVIITGANTGIGKENAIDLAKRGAKVYIACRDVKRGENALREIKESSQSEKVYFLPLDLASLESVREFSKKFHKLESKLHILINNAGVAFLPRTLTKDGFEMHFGTNHLGHFLLTNLLLDLIKAAAPSRIINVSSDTHKYSDIDKNDLMLEKSYGRRKAYTQSKLANILFSLELSKRLAGTGVTVNSCHPGIVKTEVYRWMNEYLRKYFFDHLADMLFKTPSEGAQTQIRLAVDPDLKDVTGKYFSDCQEVSTSKNAMDGSLATWLYKKSVELVKLLYVRRAKYKKDTRIPDKVVVITGANTGIGKETAVDLAKRGGKIYIACRDLKRGEDALVEIKERSQSETVYFLPLDLASLDSVRKFSKKFHKLESKLHILINNAGVAMCPRTLTKDRFEMHFGTNHLGHFLLTNLLLDLIKAASPSRIIIVSSSGHKFAYIDRNDLMGEKFYLKFKAYFQSKLANVLFTRELSKRLAGTGVTVNSCHPGLVKTEIFRYMNKYLRKYLVEPILQPIFKTPLEGAQAQIRLAVDPDLDQVTGKYFADCQEASISRQARDDDTAVWLYTKSIELVKL